MMPRFRGVVGGLAAALLAAGMSVAPRFARAEAVSAGQKVTLINGVTVTGDVVSVGPDGLELQVGQSKRTYPWPALAPGSRYRFDVSYRMNVTGYLSGTPSATWTNAPDPAYDPMKPDEALPPLDVPAVVSSSARLAALAAPAPVPSALVAALVSATSADAAMTALQIGPASNDIVVTAFSSEKTPRLAWATMRDGLVAAERSAPRAWAGAEHLAFARKTWRVVLGDVGADIEMEWLVPAAAPTRRLVQAEVRLTRGDQQALFVLQGAPGGWVKAPAAPVARPFFSEPALAFTVQWIDDKPHIVGRLRMGRLNMIPRRGMDVRVAVEVVDAAGRVQIKELLAFADDAPEGYPLRLDAAKLKPGETYRVLATMSLGAFFGNLSAEETMIMPEAETAGTGP